MKRAVVFVSAVFILFAQGAKKSRPVWVDKPEAVFSRASYIAAVGESSSRRQADANALGNLVSIFGQRVENKISAVETLRQEMNENKADFSTGQELTQAVEISASMNGLVAVEIKERWEDTKAKIFYAVAVMEKLEAIRIYNELIEANHKAIEKNMSAAAADKTSFEGVVRCRAAARIAEANELFATILTVLDGPDRRAEFGTAASYRAEAARIAKQIPVRIVIENDVQSRVSTAFAEVFSEAGFASSLSAGDARYELRASLEMNPAAPADNNLFFTRYNLDVKLIDTKSGVIIVTFAATGREAHLTQNEARQLAIRSAVRAILEDFAFRFAVYCGMKSSS